MSRTAYSNLLKNIEALLQDGVAAQVEVLLAAISSKYALDYEELKKLSTEVLGDAIWADPADSDTPSAAAGYAEAAPKKKHKAKEPSPSATSSVASASSASESAQGGCPYVFKRGRVGERCGSKPKKGYARYCSKHTKHEADEVAKVPEFNMPALDPSTRLLKLNKEVNKFVHNESGLYVRSKSDSTIVGSYRNGVLVEGLTDDDIKLCEKYGFLFERKEEETDTGTGAAKETEISDTATDAATATATETTAVPETPGLAQGAEDQEPASVAERLLKRKDRKNVTSMLKGVPKPSLTKAEKKKKRLKATVAEMDIEEVLEKVLGEGDDTDAGSDSDVERDAEQSEEEEELVVDDY